MTRSKILLLVSLPVVLGFVAAGILAYAVGWVPGALAALGVGFATSCLLAVLAVLHAVALALALLFRSVAVLWHMMQDVCVWLDIDTDDGSGGDDLESEPEPEVLYGARNAVVIRPPFLTKPGSRD